MKISLAGTGAMGEIYMKALRKIDGKHVQVEIPMSLLDRIDRAMSQ